MTLIYCVKQDRSHISTENTVKLEATAQKILMVASKKIPKGLLLVEGDQRSVFGIREPLMHSVHQAPFGSGTVLSTGDPVNKMKFTSPPSPRYLTL